VIASRAKGRMGACCRAHALKLFALRDGHVPVEEEHPIAQVDRPRRLASGPRWPQAIEEACPCSRHRARVQIEGLHEPLGGLGAIVAEAHGDAKSLLLLEAEAIGLAGRARVKAIAHAPQEGLGARDALGLAAHEHPQPDEPTPDSEPGIAAPFDDTVSRSGGPPYPVDVAQPARRALHVRLQKVDRAAEAFMTGDGFVFESIDERFEVILAEQPFAGARQERAQDVLVAGEESHVEQGRCCRQILQGERRSVCGAQYLMAHREAGVPERVEHCLGDRGCLLRVDIGVDDQNHVRIAVERNGASAEAPNGSQGDASRQSRSTRCPLEQEAKAGVEESRVGLPEENPVVATFEPTDQARAVAQHRGPQGRTLERSG